MSHAAPTDPSQPSSRLLSLCSPSRKVSRKSCGPHERYRAPIVRYTFQIGDVFPANDAVARFVTVLGMIVNDWHRSMKFMNDSLEAPADGEGVRMMLFRQQAAYLHEAAKFVADARHHNVDVESFVASLDSTALRQLDAAMATASELDRWLEDHRNVTFHYPKVVQAAHEHSDEELGTALAAAAGEEGTITAEGPAGAIRFEFADIVALELLGGLTVVSSLVKKVGEARLALGEFAYASFRAYLGTIDRALYRIEQ